MRKLLFISLTLITVIIFLGQSCNKESKDDDSGLISYPDSGFYGKNIINTKDSLYQYDQDPGFGDGAYNSLRAILPLSSSQLRIEINGSRLIIYSNQGWFTNADFNQLDNYIFEAQGQIYADLKLYFCGPGDIIIKIYENGSKTPNRIKYIKLIQ